MVRYLMDLNNILEPPYVAGLNDDKIVNPFLYGDIKTQINNLLEKVHLFGISMINFDKFFLHKQFISLTCY